MRPLSISSLIVLSLSTIRLFLAISRACDYGLILATGVSCRKVMRVLLTALSFLSSGFLSIDSIASIASAEPAMRNTP